MAETLPYLASPGSLKTCLERIRTAATPDRVTKDFVTTILQIKGGTGAALSPYLKKIGFVASDGSPTEIYKSFRNPTTGGFAAARAIKSGYSPLSNANEYFYRLGDKDLQNLIIQVTGADAEDQVAKLTFSTLKVLKGFANFDEPVELTELPPTNLHPIDAQTNQQGSSVAKLGLNLGYTFNINLPATSDQAVFNAIFRSLKENILSDE